MCTACHREITQPQDIQEHVFKDEVTGQHVCMKCNMHFSNFTKLVQHIARQHGNNVNFQCGLCQEVESMEPTGVGYICTICDIEFNIPRKLEDHMNTHGLMKGD